MSVSQKITPCLWFASQALEAAEFYTSLFPGSTINQVHRASADTPGGAAGSVLMVTFTLAGQNYQALNGGKHDAFNDAVSLSVSCDDQAEVDRLWSALTADGGKAVQCGWLKDRYGFAWQIVPKRLVELLSGPDREKSKRVMQAMMQMVKIDIAGLEAAANGTTTAPAATGHFVWYDVMTTDVAASEAFYRNVIGWNARDSGATDRSYTLFSADAQLAAGLMPIPDDARHAGVQPAWMGYIGVANLEATIARVKAAGGQIHRGPEDIPGVGRFAVAGDPTGAGFILFTPNDGSAQPQVPAGTPGHVGWCELYAGDREEAWRFYSELLGWTKAHTVETPAGLYQLFTTGQEPVGGMMTKPPHAPAPGWLFYFTVDGLGAAIDRVRAHGGEVLHGPMEVPGNSWIAQCRDPQGALFALVSKTK